MATHMNFPAGISACSDDCAASDFYRFNSRWDGFVNGEQVTVFAGCLRGNVNEGVLLIHTMPDDGLRPGGRHVSAPAGRGALRLVGWTANRLKLLAQNGDAIWFEIPAGRKMPAARIA